MKIYKTVLAKNRFHLLFSKFMSLLTIRCWRLALKGIFPAVEHAKVLKTLNNVDVVIDIGANRGQFSLIAHNILRPSNLILFEPIPNLLDSFLSFVTKRDSSVNIKHHQLALSDSSEEGVLNVTSKSDCSSMLLPTALGINYSKQSSTVVDKMQVRVCRLDDILTVVNNTLSSTTVLIKIDVQGLELNVLKGAQKFISDIASHVIIEVADVNHYQLQCSPDSIINEMSKYGFKPVVVYNSYFNAYGLIKYADILFSRFK